MFRWISRLGVCRVNALTKRRLLVLAFVATTLGACPPSARRGARRTPGSRILFQGRNRFGRLYVIQQGPRRVLRLGGLKGADQSAFDPRHPLREPHAYVRYALLALAFSSLEGRLLMIGLGGGSYLRHVRVLVPRMAREAVEINPLVVKVARKFFGLTRDAAPVVHVVDGRHFVRTTRRRYQVVFLDAFGGEGDFPGHLGTKQFFEELRGILAPGGVVVANLASPTHRKHLNLLRTFLSVFPRARIYCPRTEGNTIAIAKSGAKEPSRAVVQHRARLLDEVSGGRYGLAHAAARRCSANLSRAKVLLDR